MGEAVIDTIKSVQQAATKIPDALKKELEQVRQDLIDGKIKTGVEPLK
jgi:hypothetical protein